MRSHAFQVRRSRRHFSGYIDEVSFGYYRLGVASAGQLRKDADHVACVVTSYGAEIAAPQAHEVILRNAIVRRCMTASYAGWMEGIASDRGTRRMSRSAPMRPAQGAESSAIAGAREATRRQRARSRRGAVRDLSQGRRSAGQDARPAARHEHQCARVPFVARRRAEPSSVSDRQSRLAESLDATLEILGVAERQDAAAALDGEAGIYLERLFPGLSARLRLAEMAMTMSAVLLANASTFGRCACACSRNQEKSPTLALRWADVARSSRP